ncbi:MAG: NUDIX domain-containing protein [Micrococcus sp.]|nr:NUDIX domain-containing protein [Micrococcus sp.]
MPTEAAMRAAQRSTHEHHVDGARADVIAAGVLPWRLGASGLELMVIHRPRYDDWSWPKGKIDEGESLPECAVREVREEVGLEIVPGLPLSVTHYNVGGGKSKEVWYWAADAAGQPGEADGDEVDEIRWVSPRKARSLLTSPTDVEPLDALIAAYEEQRLRTQPLIVLRHAKAKPRSAWSRAEEDRPLAATGRRQALAVRTLVSVWQPVKLVTSPWRRCVETVTPLVQATGLGLKEKSALTEAAVRKNPKKTRAVMRSLLDKRLPLVVCSHRPVLPELLGQLAAHADTDAVLRALPTQDPYLRPGAIVVAHQGLDVQRRIVGIEVYDAVDG